MKVLNEIQLETHEIGVNNKRLNSREVSQNEVGIAQEQNESIGTGPLKRRKTALKES